MSTGITQEKSTRIDMRNELTIVGLMLVRKLTEAASFIAGDGSMLREILHPDKHPANIGYSLAWALVKTKNSTHPHTLKHNEVYYIIKGRGKMHINNEVSEITATDTVFIPPGAIQYIENTGQTDLEFLCIVDPAWQPEIESVMIKER
jgi:mannose-6-phosphate isomerase-like protein (cupin superfamily)